MTGIRIFKHLGILGVCTYFIAQMSLSQPLEDKSITAEKITHSILLYDDPIDIQGLEGLVKLGAQPRYMLIYQNNCDPDAQKTGVIDPMKVATEIIKIGGNVPEGWGVLDFESPFDDWIQKGVDSPECKKAVETMVSAIRKIKILFPKVKWTYYGLPGLLYYLGDYNWATAPEELKKKEIARQLAQYGPIMDECDWLSPCCYDTVGDGKGGIVPPAQSKNFYPCLARRKNQNVRGLCAIKRKGLSNYSLRLPPIHAWWWCKGLECNSKGCYGRRHC